MRCCVACAEAEVLCASLKKTRVTCPLRLEFVRIVPYSYSRVLAMALAVPLALIPRSGWADTWLARVRH